MHECLFLFLCSSVFALCRFINLVKAFIFHLMMLTQMTHYQATRSVECAVSLSSLLTFLVVNLVTECPPATSLSSSCLAPLLMASLTVQQRCHLNILRGLLFPHSPISLTLTMWLPPGLFNPCFITFLCSVEDSCPFTFWSNQIRHFQLGGR